MTRIIHVDGGRRDARPAESLPILTVRRVDGMDLLTIRDQQGAALGESEAVVTQRHLLGNGSIPDKLRGDGSGNRLLIDLEVAAEHITVQVLRRIHVNPVVTRDETFIGLDRDDDGILFLLEFQPAGVFRRPFFIIVGAPGQVGDGMLFCFWQRIHRNRTAFDLWMVPPKNKCAPPSGACLFFGQETT